MKHTRTQVIIAGISALILTVGLARFSYTPMLPIMRAQAGLSALDGGLLATFNYLGYISGALLDLSMLQCSVLAALPCWRDFTLETGRSRQQVHAR